MKIVQALKDCNISFKGVTKTIKNETKEQKFLGMFLGTLGARLLGNMLTGKIMLRTGYGNFLILLHLLVNFKIQKYY